MSVTYTIAHGNARSLTYWARPGIEPTASWILVMFLIYCSVTGTPHLSFLTLCLFSLCFLGPHSWHMEFPRLGVESKLQLPAYTTAVPDLSHIWNLYHSSWQHQILNPLGKARDLTCILMGTSWVCYCWAMTGTPHFSFLNQKAFLFFSALVYFDWVCTWKQRRKKPGKQQFWTGSEVTI